VKGEEIGEGTFVKKTDIIDQRFKELLAQGDQVLSTSRRPPPNVIGDNRVDSQGAQQWATSTAQLLNSLFGVSSEYYGRFKEAFRHPGFESDMARGIAVLRAAWNDYSKGYLIEATSLIRAEVFDDFLEQAQHLFEQGYHQPAAVLGGSVLEDSLRKLSDRNGVVLPSKPKLDWMNAELVKKGVYNVLVQKQITWLADVRNKAAHGLWSDFTVQDVERMLRQIRDFVTDYLA
jgi:hypothetical protein